MKTAISIFLYFLVLNCFSQNEKLTDKQYNESADTRIQFVQTIQEAEELANNDLKIKKALLFIQGGIAPVVYSTDDEFTKSYGVYYFDFGCSGTKKEISTAYNKIILEYLCTTYGKKWKKAIRKDVIGLKEFKKKNSC